MFYGGWHELILSRVVTVLGRDAARGFSIVPAAATGIAGFRGFLGLATAFTVVL